MRIIFLLTIIIYSAQLASSQNISDVARWSYQDPTGTSRTMGVANAYGAMGGDYSVVHINPAGLADFRISEFIITPSLRAQKSTGFFTANAANTTTVQKTSLGLDNLSFVIASNPESRWTSSNFAMGYTRQAFFNRQFTIEGVTPGSITTYFAEKANGIKPDDLDDFIAFPAYNTGAIFDTDKDNFYETDFASEDTPVFKSQNVRQTGGTNELTMAWAGEYDHKLNVGLALGVPIFNFEESKDYTEEDLDGSLPVFTKLTYDELLNTTGVGINVRGGATLKIANRLRIAGAFHSPTWAKFTDDYSTSLVYSFNDGEAQTYDYQSQNGSFEYNIKTPWKFVGSIGSTYQVGDLKGFVDADVEFIDYTNASYDGTAYSSDPGESTYTNEVNRDIQKKLGSATNLRLGTELAYKYLRLRLGYGIERTPFIADDFFNKRISFGIGYRDETYYVDLGIRTTSLNEGYNAYTVIDSKLDPLANIQSDNTRANLTIGFKF